MTFFAITSLVLWFIDVSPLGHSFLLSISDKVPQLGWDNIKEIENNSAYNSNTIYLYRVDYSFESLPINAGPFWEHGRFAFFLIIALFFSVINENKFLSLRNLILLCALITTFSTAGYVAMVTMAVCLLLIKNGVSWRTVFLSSIAYYIILYISQLDFMTEKIQDNALALDDTQSRFGAIAYHFLQISKSPWIGYGQFLHKVYGDLEISPNGWTDLMRYWGVPMALYMFYIIFKSAKSFMPSNEHNFAIGLTFFIIMMSVSFPQTIMTSPFFYFIYFMAFEGGENRIFYSKKQIKQ